MTTALFLQSHTSLTPTRFLTRTLMLALVILLFLLASMVQAHDRERPRPHPDTPTGAKQPSEGNYVESEILVRFKSSDVKNISATAHATIGATETHSFSVVPNLKRVKLPPSLSVRQALDHYRAHPGVLYAEPDYIMHASGIPNDAMFAELWNMHNTGQNAGTPDADIDAPEAWNITTGSRDVVVAVIDSGIDYTNDDLAPNMWRNPGECTADGIDDDNNGYVDDCHGIDVVYDDSDPMDDSGISHGTAVAGIIGAVGNNSIGVAGVNWQVSLLSCKAMHRLTGVITSSRAVTCMEYIKNLKDRGVNIVATNLSASAGVFSQAMHDAIDAHRQRNMLFIAAASDNGVDHDVNPDYPASYDLPNVIAVTSTTPTDAADMFAGYGTQTVHLAAPGIGIASTGRDNNNSGALAGTSMATPHVTGVAALLKAQNPSRDWRAIKNLILASSDPISGDTITGGRLNAYQALTCAGRTLFARLRPMGETLHTPAGSPIDVRALHINCANPNGPVSVTVTPGGQALTLLDNGVGSDQAAGDGIYSAQWAPPVVGSYTLTFPDGDTVSVKALPAYTATVVPYQWRTITDTLLVSDDDGSSYLFLSQFPIHLGSLPPIDGMYVNANGHVNLDKYFHAPDNVSLPHPFVPLTLVAPLWDDLHPTQAGGRDQLFWDIVGTVPNRELVIEWRDVPVKGCPEEDVVNFQVVFFEGRSDILFNYKDVIVGGACAPADRGGKATVGVALGRNFSFNTPSLNNSMSLLWTVDAPSTKKTLTVVNPDYWTSTLTASGIHCGYDCWEQYPDGTVVTLTATPEPGWVFTGWSGDPDCVDGMVTMNANKTCAATFYTSSPQTYILTITKTGTGAGTVIAAGINCGSDCSESHSSGTVVALTAIPTTGSTFAGWSGDDDCSDSSITMNASKTCAATFEVLPPSSSITVLTPNGGEEWTVGSKQTIRWKTSGISGKVRIQISRDGGVTWKNILAGTPNDGAQTWKVAGAPTTQARIRILTVTNLAVMDTSDGNFTIR